MALLNINKLCFRWPSATYNVIDIDKFVIEVGEHTFVMGPSGSGKSTLLNIVGGIIQPIAGSVELLGQDLKHISGPKRDRIRADTIGYIFQQFNLIPYLNAEQNVVLACQFSQVRTSKACERSGSIQHEARRLIQTLMDDAMFDLQKPVSALSVGQQQRIAAARALIGSPPLLIADEPTSSLDHNARQIFMQLLLSEAAAHGCTVLFVSHDPTLQEHFTRRVTMAEINRCHTL